MRSRVPWLALVLLLSGSATGRATPLQFDLGDFTPPAPAKTMNQPSDCTVTYLMQDYAANETYAERMVFAPAPNAVAQNGVMPCPALVPARVAQAALDQCRDHAANKRDCVFADMGRGFQDAPGEQNTAENASRCASDQASHIAIACWNANGLQVCNVGCGNSAPAAVAAARSRCELKHQKACNITDALPVAAP